MVYLWKSISARKPYEYKMSKVLHLKKDLTKIRYHTYSLQAYYVNVITYTCIMYSHSLRYNTAVTSISHKMVFVKSRFERISCKVCALKSLANCSRVRCNSGERWFIKRRTTANKAGYKCKNYEKLYIITGGLNHEYYYFRYEKNQQRKGLLLL